MLESWHCRGPGCAIAAAFMVWGCGAGDGGLEASAARAESAAAPVAALLRSSALALDTTHRQLVVHAGGTFEAGIGPLMEVRADGAPLGVVEVRSANRQDYRFVLDGAATPSRVDVVYLNPGSAGTRHLDVDWVEAEGRRIASTDASVRFDAGDIDGQDVGAGIATLVQAGGLSFPTAAAACAAQEVPTLPIIVNAAGSPAAGVWPSMEVSVPGRPVSRVTVGSWGLSDYRFDLGPIPAGTTVDVRFANDAFDGREDRNLFVEGVQINGRMILPIAPGVVYDRGAVDDADVLPGQGALLWTGSLRFRAPEPASPSVAPCQSPAPPSTTAPDCGPQAFCSLVGLNVKFSQGQPASELPMLDELGVRWVRDSVRASDIEPVAGQYADFSDDVKARLAYYRDHGIGVVFVMPLNNAVAYPDRPYDAVAYGRRAVQIANMLRAAGVRFVLEVGNEPHNELYWVFGGQWQGKAPSRWVDQYVEMVRQAVRQVKSHEASVKLLADDDMWIAHYWFLEAGLPPDLDGLAVHPYSPGAPEIAAVLADTDWTRPFQVVDADASMSSAVRRLRERAREKLGRTPEIWVTEIGWAVGSDAAAIDESRLANYLPRFFVAAAGAGVRTVQWFSSQDSVDGPMGLTTNSGERRRPYQSFKVMSQQLGRHRLVEQSLGSDHPTRGLQAYSFSAQDRQKLVAWSADTQLRVLRVRPGLQVESLTGVNGEPLDFIVSSVDGAALLVVGAAPVYVTVRHDRPIVGADLGEP